MPGLRSYSRLLIGLLLLGACVSGSAQTGSSIPSYEDGLLTVPRVDVEGLGFFSSASYAAIQQAREQRLIRLRMAESLPKRRSQMEQLQTVRNTEVELQTLLNYLPDEVSTGLQGQAEVALAAFASGLAVSANLNAGGFDTHGDHDTDHSDSLTQLLQGIDHLWDQIEAQGLQDKVTVVVGSDFGRTPFYNEGNGKDHWNITSIMAMGAGITGNRVIGATDENFEVLALNPSSLQLDDSGILITPHHIHRSLRDFLGVTDELDNLFPIGAEKLDLFGKDCYLAGKTGSDSTSRVTFPSIDIPDR